MELSPEDRNSVVRTMLSEDGRSAPGMAAVAWTIRNRAESGKFQDTPGGVVMARHAYEPWSLPRRDANHPLNHSATSPEYQQATRIADGVFSGETPDVTNGATHFYDPRAQAGLGRRPPSWARGEPLATVGSHLFYAPDGGGQRAINAALKGGAGASGLPASALPLDEPDPAVLQGYGIMRGAAPPAAPEATVRGQCCRAMGWSASRARLPRHRPRRPRASIPVR